jgi:hypothetical protein
MGVSRIPVGWAAVSLATQQNVKNIGLTIKLLAHQPTPVIVIIIQIQQP